MKTKEQQQLAASTIKAPEPFGELRLLAQEGDAPELLACVFGDEPLSQTLQALGYSPKHSVSEGSPLLEQARTQLEEYFAGQRYAFSLPYRLSGTPFRCQAWEQLAAIPYGQTRSYGSIAQALGKSPQAARAVGQAMGTNLLAIILPCHRVLGANGDLVGFGGGLERKRWLLAHEAAVLHRSHPPVDELSAAYHQLSRDPILGSLVQREGPPTLSSIYPEDPFAALATTIIYQQISGKAAASIVSRVCALSNDSQFPDVDSLLSFKKEALRACGVSTSKCDAIFALAEACQNGSMRLDELSKQSDEDIHQQLCSIRGIGPWTSEIFLLFHLARLDTFPAKDGGLCRALEILFGLSKPPSKEEIAHQTEPWRPYRGIAAWYLWRMLDGSGGFV